MQSRFRQRKYKLNTIKEVNENKINYSLSDIELNNNVKVKRVHARNRVTAKKLKPRPRSDKIIKRFTSSLTGKTLVIPPKKSLQTINIHNKSLPGFLKGLPPRPTHKPQHNFINTNQLKGVK